PNSNLDEAGEQALVEAIARLREHKRTLILITHKSSLLAGLDNLLMLKGGQLQAFGPTARVLQDAQRAARPAPAPVAPSSTRNPIGLSVTFGQPRA
ncbi:type I secretion system permease/ATPase, partial [Pseudomonas mosselii]|nr:type I secretion system permease/ATPase [Pseudomonas mosselii]